jgi:predicted RNase H-like HicB family nuclease
MKYGVVVEKAEGNFSAYIPDLPGCVATGGSVSEVLKEIREAVQLHLQGMKEDGEAIPKPTSRFRYVEMRASRQIHKTFAVKKSGRNTAAA